MNVGEPTQLQIRVLGDIVVAGPGARPLAGPTQRRAFALLVVQRNETTTMDQLVEACWPGGDTPKRAEHNVRTYVHRLRTALGESDDRIETSAVGYRFRLEAAETDVDRFEQLAAEADRLVGSGDLAAALDRIGEAESLWRGRPYAEFAEERWAEAEVARLVETHHALMERRAEALMDAGRAADAVGGLEQLVRDEPYRERPRALLMRGLYESGRQAEALRVFQEFRRFLIDDAGVEPSPDLVYLDRQIASGELESSGPTRVVGNYELHERIGEGAFANVHRATQVSLGREVAVKIVRAELANRPEFVRRFEAEARMVAAIEHPSVVPLYDYWREPGHAYLVMRWMTGGSLETRLDSGPLDLDTAVAVVEAVAAALDAAHAHDIVHRDVKPANILFDDAGRALLGDFGIALEAEERSTPQAALSEGSPIFASPEQLRREPAGPEADVHALGIVAFTALAGRTPFQDAADEAELLRRQLSDPIPALSAVRADIPIGVDEVIATATAKQAAHRYPTAGGFAAAFRAAASGIAATVATVPVDRSNPYVGLRAFGEADAAMFHGRARLVDELLETCRDPGRRLLAVVGPSGSGKSSVVRAGLIPALRAGRVRGSASWFATTMLPGANPYEALETALLRIATNPPSALLEQLRDGDRGIHRGVSRIVPDDESTVLLVIDQFEELFTATAGAERQRFLRALATAVTEPGGPLRVVATMRADFYDRPLRHPEFAPLFKTGSVAVTPLAPDELEEVITAPAAAVGVGFEPGLIAEVVADVNSQPGALPLLQYALTQTYDALGANTLTTKAYRSVGGLTGALAGRAESLHDDFAGDERYAMRRLLGRLVTLGDGTQDTRRRVRLDELLDDDATRTVLEHLGAARLLTFDHDPATREPTVELAHEALIREWPRLADWLDEDRQALRTHRHLASAADSWNDRGRDPSELFRGGRLEAAESLRSEPNVALNPLEVTFLDASIHQREAVADAERSRVRRLRRLVAATAVVAVAALLAGAFAVVQRNRANAEAERRDIDRVRATAVGRTVDDPVIASLLAVEAYRADPSVDSLRTLQQVLSDGSGFRRSLGTGPYTGAELLDDGTTLVALAPDALEVWDLRTASLERRLPHANGSEIGVLDVGSDGRTVVARAGDRTTRIYDLAGVEETRVIEHDGAITSLSLSADSTQLAAAGGDRVDIWDLTSMRRVASMSLADLLDQPDAGRSIAFVRWSPAVDRIAVVDDSSAVYYWDPATPAPSWSAATPADGQTLTTQPTSVLFSSDGAWLVVESGRLNSVIRTFDVHNDGAQPYPETSKPAVPSGSVPDDLFWVDEDNLIVGDVQRPDIVALDLKNAAVHSEVLAGVVDPVDVVHSVRMDRIVAVGDTLALYSTDRSGPLERVVPFSDELLNLAQTVGGSVYTGLAPDGSRVSVSMVALPHFPTPIEADLRTASIDPQAVGTPGQLFRSHGRYTMTVDPLGGWWQLLDASGRPLGDPAEFPGDLTDFEASPDGRFVAFGRRNGLVDLSTGDGTFVATLDVGAIEQGPDSSTIPSFSADGEFLAAVAAPDWEVAMWSTSSLERLDHQPPADWRVGEFSGGWFTVSRTDDSIARFDPSTLEQVGPALVDARSYRGFELDESNHRMALTDGSNTIVWDLESGTRLTGEMPAAQGGVQFTEDGTLLSVPGRDRVTLWNLDTDTWADIACDVAGRNLTRDEWESLGPRTIEYGATCDQYPIES